MNNINERYLDLVIASFPCEVTDNELPLLAVDKYHPPLLIKFENVTPNNFSNDKFNFNPNILLYNFKKCDFSKLYTSLLNTYWTNLRNSNYVNVALQLFYDIIIGILETEVGCVRNTSMTYSYPHWYTKEIIHQIKLKNKFRKKYKISGNAYYLEAYKYYRINIKSLIHKQHKLYLKKIECEVISNPNFIWAHVNRSKKTFRIPAIVYYNDLEITNPQ